MLRSYLVFLGISLFFACSKPNNPTPTPPTPPGTDTNKTVSSSDTSHWKTIKTGITALCWDLWFTDTLHGIMTANDSILYRTTDGGQTWKPAISTKGDFNAIWFISAQQGFVAGTRNFGYTLDGGDTWITKDIRGVLIDSLSPVYAPNYPWPNLQFLSGSSGYLTTGRGLYMTTDTGTTWKIVNSKAIHAAYFISPTVGYSYTAGTVSMTTDGGITWQPAVTIPSASKNPNSAFDLLQFTDAQHGWYFSGLSLGATSDGGQSWQALPPFQTTFSAGSGDFQMISNQVGYICNYTIKKTTDGGVSWQQEADLGNEYVAGIFLLDANHGWVCGANGKIYKFHP